MTRHEKFAQSLTLRNKGAFKYKKTKYKNIYYYCVHKYIQLLSHSNLVTNIYNLNPKSNTRGKHCKGSGYSAPSIYMKETLENVEKKRELDD